MGINILFSHFSHYSFDAITLGHWGIENQLHWVLDVGFNKNDSRIRKDNPPENLAVIRHIALNLIKQHKSIKGSIKGKQKRAGWDNNYLRELLLT